MNDLVGGPAEREPGSRLQDHQRELTVMFVDMVGSTPMAERLDAEELRDLVLGYHEICDQAIHRYDGFVVRRVGDGLLACFGHPHAHEDDARRAVMAGLSIIESMGPLSRRLAPAGDLAVEVRVAVHTGPVVLTHIGDTLELVGSTVNEAARLESEASPGEVLISDATRRLVHQHFEVEPRGEAELRGVSRRMVVHAVRGPSDASEMPAAVSTIIGRDRERSALLSMWERVKRQDDAQVPDDPAATSQDAIAFLVAEPGIGKTRLAQWVCDAAARDDSRSLVTRCRPFDADVPFHPLVSTLQRAMTIDDAGPVAARYAALRDGLAVDGADPDALAPHLGQLLDLGADLLDPDDAAQPALLRASIIRSLIEWFRARAERQPFVLLVEDVQWADPSTLEVVAALVRASPLPGLLTILTARPEFHAPWADEVTTLRLDRLAATDAAALCRQLAESQSLSDEQVETVLARSGGVPLFVEGLVTSVRPGRSSAEGVPSDVRSLLDSMIHAPGVDPQFVSLLATIGPEVDVELVAAVAGSDVEVVRRRCEALHDHRVLDRVPDVVPDTFTFHHALIRAEAYDQQLASDRRAAHGMVVDAIVGGASVRRLDPATTARHLDLGGRPRDAIEYYLTAIRSGQQKGAHAEARRLVERVLELLTHLPPSPARDRLELHAQLRLGLTLTSTEGYGSSRALRTLERARELARSIGDTRRHVEVLGDIFSYHSVRGERLDSIDVIREMEEVAASSEADLGVDVLMFDGLLQFTLGHFARSRACYSEAIDRLVARGVEAGGALDRIAAPTDGLAAGCAMMIPLALLADDLEGALAWTDRGLARSASLGAGKGTFSEGFVRSWIAFQHTISGEFDAAIAAADEMIRRADRAGLPMWSGLGTAHRTIAAGHLAPEPVHDELLGAIIDAMATMGVAAMAPYFLTHHGLIRARLGQPSDGIGRLTEAIEIAEQNGELHYQAETLRHRARLRLDDPASDEPSTAIADLRTAADLACEQGAPLYAATALADLVDVARVEPGAELVARVAACLDGLHPASARAEVARARELVRGHAGVP